MEHLWRTPIPEPQTEPRTEPRTETRTETEPTTDTQSFDTADEPAEDLSEISSNQNQPETEILVTEMENPLENPDVNMNDNKPKEERPKATELKLKQPASFSGKREELDNFLEDILLYLDVNDEVYYSDKKKIGFTLAFMDKGDAKSWKTQFLKSCATDTGIDMGTWTAFLTKIKEDFKPYDAPGDALDELLVMKMGNSSIEDHVSRFKVLLAKSEVPETSLSAIDYFRKTLSIPLQKKLLDLAEPPKDLDDWYKWATRLDNNYRKIQRIFHRETGKLPDKGKDEPKKKWTFQKKEKDPNAMDVDTLSVERRAEMMKKGLCFGCEKPGHLYRDCPNRKKPTTSTSPPVYSPPKKMGAKELYTHIRSLTAMMNEDEKEEFYQEAEKEGF